MSREVFRECFVAGDPLACWPWTGALTREGYGRHRGRSAARVAYERAIGPIPAGLTLDHTCHTRACIPASCQHRRCVNPAHLEPVTHLVNTRRGSAPSTLGLSRPTCRNGHQRTPENTHTVPDGSRVCRVCNREAAARLKARHRAEAGR